MDQELFNPQSSSVSSSRIIYTPSTFARTSLLHLQEVGSLQAVRKSSNMSTGQQKSPHFQRGLSGSCKNNKCIKNQDFLYLLGHSF